MSSSLETDVRHVLRLGQLGNTMTHTRKPIVVGGVARSPRTVADRITTYFIEYPSWLLRQVHLKSDVVVHFFFFEGIMCATTKRDDGDENDKGLPTHSIIDQSPWTTRAILACKNGLWNKERCGSPFATLPVAGLQGAAVTSKNILLAIPHQMAERGRGVYNEADVSLTSTTTHEDDRSGTELNGGIGRFTTHERTEGMSKPEAEYTGRPSAMEQLRAEREQSLEQGHWRARTMWDWISLRMGGGNVKNTVRGGLERGWWFWKGLLARIHAHSGTEERRCDLIG